MDSILVLLGNNLIYALPCLAIPILVALLGDASRSVLKTINKWVERVSSYLMPVMLALVGLALVVDAMLFFITRKGLFAISL